TRVSVFTEWINKVRDQNNFGTLMPVGAPGVPTAAPPNLDFVFNATTTVAPPTTAVPEAITQNTMKISQSLGPARQMITSDGSLAQIGADGSIQQTKALPPPTLLDTVVPGVFRSNVVGSVNDLFNSLTGMYAFSLDAISIDVKN